MSIERVVALLTPLFAALAGVITSAAGQLVPGVTLNPADVTALFIAGSTAAAAAALKWLHGRQKFVQQLHATWAPVGHFVEGVKADAVAGPALEDIEKVLRAHTEQIISAVGSAVHAPPSVEQIMQAMAKALAHPAPAPAPAPPAAVPPPPPVQPQPGAPAA